MNRTKIETCDYTWNPVTGCWGPGGTAEKPNRCSYCYAHGMVKRFNPFENTGYIQLKTQCVNNDPFQPLFWPNRLSQPAKVKKPSKIFVCSMADLFGDWVPDDWILKVLAIIEYHAPQHMYQFLTKNPKRLKDFNPWPSNCWVGTTVTNQDDADKRLPWLLAVWARTRFISFEPLLGSVDIMAAIRFVSSYVSISGNGFDWAIIGAQTGPGAVRPKPEWVRDLIDQHRAAGVPLFLKDNLNWPEKIQEWPK